ANDWQVIGTFEFKHLIRLPLTVLPRINRTSELTEINLRVKVGGKILTVAASVDIDNIDIRHRACIHHVIAKTRIGIDHTRIKSSTQNCRDVLVGTALFTLPFIVVIPWRRLTNLARILMNGGINISRARFNTSL